MKLKALKICIENNAPTNPQPYQEDLIIIEYPSEIGKTFWEIEINGDGKSCYHFKQYLNCYCIQNIYYEVDRFVITKIESIKAIDL